ncbi:MAG TPA: LysR substrate-binding domain-containing protein [Verrucomicrobiae bacterium]|nr:LysR substrate-binding domain-containing protein [Verrucomicrobiae bacterium]
MRIEELRAFVILAGHLHFGRAAQVLHVSQPALTKQIRRLEESLGGRLLERGKHGTKLSAFGARFVTQAKDVVESFDRLGVEARKVAAGHAGELRIGFGSYTLEPVPRLVVKLRTLAPGIEVSLRDMSTSEQIAALQLKQLDVGFTRLPLPASAQDLQSLPVLSGQLALVSPARPFHGARLRLEDCRDKPFVILSKQRSQGLYDKILAICAGYGFHPRVVQEVSEVATAVALVRSGMGLCIMPQSPSARRFPGVTMQPLPGKAAAWSAGAVWRRRDSNPALHRFLELLRKELS